ncbi:MAG TPA: ornithine--oxo-acid transaminase [Gammaproteobacteria bacterium]|nr:ornithine--oxo-acid transaminase [Gammaproteobacteria bacterium]
MHPILDTENRYSANNYLPLPVVLVKGEGCYLWDINGKQYLDMMSAYSAVSHGHCHPVLVEALTKQAQQLCVCSRAFYSDKLAPFLEYACELIGLDKAIPMNSGAEAVETAVKVVRKWGYVAKGIPDNQAEIIVLEGNFHGRTTTVISFSSEPQYRQCFGPLTPGFKCIPYGDADALENAISANTAAFLVEPIQGESGIRVPPSGYLKKCAEICAANNVLFISDEVQTGLGRTGKMLACQHEDVKPDGVILGKALGGGLLPVSMFLARSEVMDVLNPGDHGSTFGGNPLAATIGLTALRTLVNENMVANSAELGSYFLKALSAIKSPLIKEVRGKGLFIGVEIDTRKVSARDVCLQLIEDGLLTKDTHGTVIRLCPPLVVTRAQIDEALRIIKHSLAEIERVIG